MTRSRLAMLTAMAAIAGAGVAGPADTFTDFVDVDGGARSGRRPRHNFVPPGEVIELHNPPGSSDPNARNERVARRKAARRLRATRGRR